MELGCSRWQWWMLEIWSPMSLVLLQDLMCAWSRVWLKLVLSLLKVTSGHSLLDGLGAMPQLVLHGVGLRVARWLLMSSSLVLGSLEGVGVQVALVLKSWKPTCCRMNFVLCTHLKRGFNRATAYLPDQLTHHS